MSMCMEMVTSLSEGCCKVISRNQNDISKTTHSPSFLMFCSYIGPCVRERYRQSSFLPLEFYPGYFL